MRLPMHLQEPDPDRISAYDLDPPIPGGPYWQAVLDDDPEGLRGEGASREAAITNLVEQWQDAAYDAREAAND